LEKVSWLKETLGETMKKVLFPIFSVVVLSCLLISCGAPAQTEMSPDTVASQQQEELPTSTPLPPTNTSPPEQTATIALTATPESQIFRDDFNGSLQPGWTWELEDSEKWSFVEIDGNGWLQIVGNPGRSNFLTRDVPAGDFVISAHIKADPYLNFHQANIFIFQDMENYVLVNTGYCDKCQVGGYGYFMETVASGGDEFHHYETPRPADATDVYLKIEVVDDIISGYYATVPGEWTRIGRFGNFYTLNTIGLGATNSSPPSGTLEDIIAQFDYFEVTLP
jgi:beta-xylosidase